MLTMVVVCVEERMNESPSCKLVPIQSTIKKLGDVPWNMFDEYDVVAVIDVPRTVEDGVRGMSNNDFGAGVRIDGPRTILERTSEELVESLPVLGP